MLRYIFSLLLIFIVLTACTGLRAHLPSEIIEETVNSSVTKTETSIPPLGEIFLLQSTISTPIRYRLARFPSACLLMDLTCPKPEIVRQFPATEFSPASLSLLQWSPDGLLALFLNAYNSQLLVLDSANLQVNLLPTELPIVSDRIAWSPDSEWVALEVEGSDPYASHLYLMNLRSHEGREIQTGLEGMQQPLGWLDTNHLLFIQERYEDTGGDISKKKNIVGERIYKLNIRNLHSEVLIPDFVILGGSLPVLSPSRQLIALNEVRNDKHFLEIYSSDGKRIQSFEGHMYPAWSTDSQWIAVTINETSGYSVVLLNPEGSEERKLISLESQPQYVWSPDSLKLMILTSATKEGENEADLLYIISTSGDRLREIKTTDIVDGDYRLMGVSIKPDTHR